jgi:hypothetical protein
LPWLRHCHAAGVITASPEASDEDLLALSPHTWLPAEWAACTLYVRTRRPRKDSGIESFSMDHDDWERYLRDEIHVA